MAKISSSFILFFLLTYYSKGAHYSELPDGEAELSDVSVDTKLPLKRKSLCLHFVLVNQIFQTMPEKERHSLNTEGDLM